jgi:hypothetical protein
MEEYQAAAPLSFTSLDLVAPPEVRSGTLPIKRINGKENGIVLAKPPAERSRLKALVLDSVASSITRSVYNLALDEFFTWFAQEPRAGFSKATVAAWRVALQQRGLGPVSINARITAVRKLAVEAADNGLLAPELANGIIRVKGVPTKGVRLGNWISTKQAHHLERTHVPQDSRFVV